MRNVALDLPEMDLVCCEMVIENELEHGLPLGEIAKTYALAIRSESNRASRPDWPRINTAIKGRFGAKGLDQVKKIAWRILFTPPERYKLGRGA